MKFEELHKMIPYAKGGKEKTLTMQPYSNITLAMPGRHAMETTPVGGDFVVMVDDPAFKRPRHQFTHTDIFKDLAAKYEEVPNATFGLMENYLDIIKGADPDKIEKEYTEVIDVRGVHDQTFLYAVQCLAVAEHRRYAKYEISFGGRYLPFRFGAGIVEGLWTAADAAEKQKKGRPGVEWLERDFGMPRLTKELMNG